MASGSVSILTSLNDVQELVRGNKPSHLQIGFGQCFITATKSKLQQWGFNPMTLDCQVFHFCFSFKFCGMAHTYILSTWMAEA